MVSKCSIGAVIRQSCGMPHLIGWVKRWCGDKGRGTHLGLSGVSLDVPFLGMRKALSAGSCNSAKELNSCTAPFVAL